LRQVYNPTSEEETEMKVTIITDNIKGKPELKTEWGFACLVETHGRRILFDTGGTTEVLMHNMETLGIDPASITEVVISYPHDDHAGALKGYLEAAPITTYVPGWDAALGEVDATTLKEPLELCDGVHVTGELNDIEQSLVVRTGRGVAVVVGCSHSGVGDILQAASVFGEPHALIGGLHGFDDLGVLRALDLICATHCTQQRDAIRAAYPEQWVEGGGGAVVEIGEAPE
jgi:7,8-dihydropterin-6-yl-methyl-4-(beta-D-ribofuranosyl)aminobenzene 5'-phosphate synthase